MYERGNVSRVGPELSDRVALALADLDDASKPLASICPAIGFTR